MSYVRSRVEEFEKTANNKEQQQSDSTAAAGRKKFLYPGRRQRQSNSVTRGGDKAPVANSRIPATAAGGARNSFETVFESELQEVWSVRRNVHHNSMATGGGNMTTNVVSSNDVQSSGRGPPSYSRHNQQSAHLQGYESGSRGAPAVGSSTGLVGNDRNRRFPLQDHNHNHQTADPTARRLDTSRTPFYSSDTTPKRLNHSPTGDSPPSAKKKIDGPHQWMQQPSATPAEEKVSYAKRMAQAHMKSVGIGNYTPQQDGYSQQGSVQGRVHWQKHDSTDDEFSF